MLAIPSKDEIGRLSPLGTYALVARCLDRALRTVGEKSAHPVATDLWHAVDRLSQLLWECASDKAPQHLDDILAGIREEYISFREHAKDDPTRNLADAATDAGKTITYKGRADFAASAVLLAANCALATGKSISTGIREYFAFLLSKSPKQPSGIGEPVLCQDMP
jgi:hypothetical protein